MEGNSDVRLVQPGYHLLPGFGGDMGLVQDLLLRSGFVQFLRLDAGGRIPGADAACASAPGDDAPDSDHPADAGTSTADNGLASKIRQRPAAHGAGDAAA